MLNRGILDVNRSTAETVIRTSNKRKEQGGKTRRTGKEYISWGTWSGPRRLIGHGRQSLGSYMLEGVSEKKG